MRNCHIHYLGPVLFRRQIASAITHILRMKKLPIKETLSAEGFKDGVIKSIVRLANINRKELGQAIKCEVLIEYLLKHTGVTIVVPYTKPGASRIGVIDVPSFDKLKGCLAQRIRRTRETRGMSVELYAEEKNFSLRQMTRLNSQGDDHRGVSLDALLCVLGTEENYHIKLKKTETEQ